MYGFEDYTRIKHVMANLRKLRNKKVRVECGYSRPDLLAVS